MPRTATADARPRWRNGVLARRAAVAETSLRHVLRGLAHREISLDRSADKVSEPAKDRHTSQVTASVDPFVRGGGVIVSAISAVVYHSEFPTALAQGKAVSKPPLVATPDGVHLAASKGPRHCGRRLLLHEAVDVRRRRREELNQRSGGRDHSWSEDVRDWHVADE